MSTAGFQTFNNNAYLNITQDSKAYVFLKKYEYQYQLFYKAEPRPHNVLDVYVVVDCVGFPVVYFDIPYGTTGPQELPNTYANAYNNYYARSGCNVRSIKSLGNNKWGVRLSTNGSFDKTPYLYVFGRLDKNYPNGAGLKYGIQVFDVNDGGIVFDSNLRMLRLAGNTYDTEIVLKGDVPTADNTSPSGYQLPNVYDTVITTPFSMQNKAVFAGTRGMVYFPYLTGTRVEDGQQLNSYDIGFYQTMYWANGSELQARRIAFFRYQEEIAGDPSIIAGIYQTVYSRLSVIDTTLFQ